MFIAYDAILFCVIGFALHSSVKSANWEFPGQIDKYVSSLSIIYILNMLVLIVLALLFGPAIGDLLGLETVVVIALIVHSFGSALVTLYNARISLQYSYKKYMVVAASSSIGNVALSLLLVFTVFYGHRYLGRILGATIALAIVGVALLGVFWRKARPKINLSYWKFGLRYSLPIVPHGISQVVLAQFGRLMVNYMVSTVAAGIYGLAANLMIVMTVLTDSISTVWSTWFYEAMEGESADKATAGKSLSSDDLKKRESAIQHRSSQLMLGFAILSVALMAVAPEMIWVLGGDAYMEGAYCAFGMILSGYCVFLYNLIVVGEYYKQKTNYVMLGTILAAGINVLFNLWAIPAFGYLSAAFTTLAAYVFYVIFHGVICKMILGFSILHFRKSLLLAAVLLIMMGIDILAFDSFALRLVAGVICASALIWALLRKNAGASGIKSILGR